MISIIRVSRDTGRRIIGYMSLSKESGDFFVLHDLSVLPEYRHNELVHTGTKVFDHLPFTSGYLEWKGE